MANGTPAVLLPKHGIRSYHGEGRLVDPFNFKAEDLTVTSLARGFARINRFSGAGRGLEVITDAQHQVTLSHLVPDHLAKAALLHEMPELFMGDVPKPFKDAIPQIEEMENRILRRTSEVFCIPYANFLRLKPFDIALGRDEARYLMPSAEHRADAGLGIEVTAWDPKWAVQEWSKRFYELFGTNELND